MPTPRTQDRWPPGTEEALPSPLAPPAQASTEKAVLALSHQATRDPQALWAHLKGAPYHFYRILQAAASACYAEPSLQEDWLTQEFLQGLNAAAASLAGDAGDPLVAVKPYGVMKHRVPAVQESQIGTDLVLLVAGRALLGHDGAKVFWIQAKQPGPTAFKVKVAQDNTQCRFRQASALLRLDDPGNGSHAVYLLYGDRDNPAGAHALWSAGATALVRQGEPSTTALLALPCKMKPPAGQPRAAPTCRSHSVPRLTPTLPMLNVACRVQEHLTQLLLDDPKAAFGDAKAFRDFLSDRLDLEFGMSVVGLLPKGDRAAAQLLDEIEQVLRSGIDKELQAAADAAKPSEPPDDIDSGGVPDGASPTSKKKGRRLKM